MAGRLHAVRVETDVTVRMRDGVILRADVYRPEKRGRFPVVLERTPYNRAERRGAHVVMPAYLAQRGYAVVVQDVRGRFGSDGEFRPFHQEVADGYDTIAWCARQPWSTGKVGTYGGSYVGATQMLAAMSQPEALACMVPLVTTDGYYEGWTYQGGALQLGFTASWALFALVLQNMAHTASRKRLPKDTVARMVRAIDGMPASLRGLPTRTLAGLPRSVAPYYDEWLRHPRKDRYWDAVDVGAAHARMDVPALHVAGWFDIFLGGSLRNYAGMRAKAPSPRARDGQRLIVGPWAHTAVGAASQGERYFGMQASPFGLDLLAEHLRWFDYWLKGMRNGALAAAPVRIFVMGDNRWRDEQEWPLARTRYVDYYLHGRGNANTADGDGTLTVRRPGAVEPPDSFTYDPADPVPTHGGALCCYPALLPGGPLDQRRIEERPDVLCYTTPPLTRDLEVTGPLTVTLYAATDGPDTDFTAKLVDVCPEGCAHALADGIIRARYRNGTRRAVLVTPGGVNEYTIDLGATSNVFKRGHRIRLEVSSSNFPRFDRNPNTGEEPASARATRAARQTVLHTARYASRIRLPVIPR